MPRTTKLTRYLVLNLLFGSVGLLAQEPRIHEMRPQGEPKKSAEPNKAKEKYIAPENRMRVGVKGLFGQDIRVFFVGESERKVGLAPAVGVGAIFDYPLFYFLSLGAQFDTRFGVTKKSREFISFDINAFVKTPFSLGVSKPFPNFYLLIPVGFSLGRVLSEQVKLKSIYKGVNFGGFLGKEFFFAERYGVLIEAGYAYRYLGAETQDGTKFSIHFHQIAANVGFTFGL
jgi:hypothetical protein